jgi:hypothetical protein
MQIEQVSWAVNKINTAHGSRDWSALPSDFEAAKVAMLFVEIKPIFGERDIKQRIEASKACTFVDLLAAIGVDTR